MKTFMRRYISYSGGLEWEKSIHRLSSLVGIILLLELVSKYKKVLGEDKDR